MNRKLVLAIIGLMIVSSLFISVTAVPKLLIDVIPVDDKISYDEVAEYNVELTNNQDRYEKITIPAPRNKWDITIRPYVLELQPRESKNVSIRIAPPADTKAGVYSVYFEFVMENSSEKAYTWINTEVISDSPVVASRVSLIEELEIQERTSKSFLSKEYVVVITNKGNIAASDSWEVEIAHIESFFVDSNPLAFSSETDGEHTLTWNYNIDPGQSQEFQYTVSYWSLFIALILLVVALIMLAFYYISKFRLRKEVVTTKHGDDSYVKIKLAIKNKTNQLQKNVLVEDYVPVPFGLSREFGTIKPDAIKKKKDKLVLVWKFEELQPREERIVSYKMKAQLEVLGKVTIPPAYLKQRTAKKMIQVYSRILQKDRL